MEYPNLTKQESAELQEYLSTHQDDLLTHIVQFNELMRKYQAATKEIISLIKSDRRCGLPPARIFLQRY